MNLEKLILIYYKFSFFFRKISNFAVLKYEDYCLLKDGFKEWTDELQRIDHLLRIEILSNLDYFNHKQEVPAESPKSENHINEQNLYKVSDDLIGVKYIILLSKIL